MAVSEVAVCNSALVKVGASRISALTEDNKQAQILNEIFPHMRDDVLRSHPWNFSIRREILSPNSTTPAYEYDFTYDIPNDILRVLDMDDDEIEWVVEGRTILSNEETLNARMIFRQDDPSEWDSMFAEALAWRLATEIAYALTQSIALRDDCAKMYERTLSLARSMDGMEGTLKGLTATTWTKARKK